MTNPTPISSSSLNLNDSWISHIGSRIYRLGVEMIELLSTAFSYPLIQPYSGKRLYQLVDTFRHSISKNESYNEARLGYSDNILKALGGEKNILTKTKRVRTILNTHIIGLSILQDKNKKSLSDHIGYSLLPSLINEFGIQMANKAYLALDTLNDSDVQKNFHDYSRLYRDIRLDQTDLDSFVEALQELNGNVPRDILIHELILARNKHLTYQAKDKIVSTLKDEHYINVRLENRLHLMVEDKSQIDKKEITRELETNRNIQLEALLYSGPSMFFPKEAPVVDEETGSLFEDALDVPQFVIPELLPESSVTEPISEIPTLQPTKEFELLEIPIGIANFNQSCWYNSALQIMNNTALFDDISQKKDLLSKNFPMIFESFQLYQTYREKESLDSLNLMNQMQPIRSEIHHKIAEEFKSWGAGHEDSKQLLFHLLKKLSIDVSRTTVYGDDLYTLTSKFILIDKPASDLICLETLFAGTNYTTDGMMFHTRFDTENTDPTQESVGHYFAAVRKNNTWYLCNDAHVKEISLERLQHELNTNSAFIIATRVEDVDVDVDDYLDANTDLVQ